MVYHDLWGVYDRIPQLPVNPPYREENNLWYMGGWVKSLSAVAYLLCMDLPIHIHQSKYHKLFSFLYREEGVNHSVEFVSPTGVTTNHAERYWRSLKDKFHRMQGVARSTMPSHVEEFLWRERFKNSVIDSIMEHMGLMYPVN